MKATAGLLLPLLPGGQSVCNHRVTLWIGNEFVTVRYHDNEHFEYRTIGFNPLHDSVQSSWSRDRLGVGK